MSASRWALLALVLALFCAQPALADCRVHAGEHVVLYGTTDDPDVFVWGSRFRLRLYQEGTWDQARVLIGEASLAPPGTRAIVLSCVPSFVVLKYSNEEDDAVGITIVSGPLRGKTGWVLGTDIRGVYHHISKQAAHSRRFQP